MEKFPQQSRYHHCKRWFFLWRSRKEYSGRFNLRVSPELHREIATITASKNKSINQWITEILQEAVQSFN